MAWSSYPPAAIDNWRSAAKASVVKADRPVEASSGDEPLAKALMACLGNLSFGDRKFAESLLGIEGGRGYAKYRRFTDGQRPYVVKLIEKGKTPAPAYVPPPEKVVSVKIPDGVYAVEQRRYRVDNVVGGNWDGWVFIKDGSEYGAGRRVASSRPGQNLVLGKSPTQFDKGDLESIAADPLEAAKQYGRITGRCGICNRVLENPESVAVGIGPVCAGRFA